MTIESVSSRRTQTTCIPCQKQPLVLQAPRAMPDNLSTSGVGWSVYTSTATGLKSALAR